MSLKLGDSVLVINDTVEGKIVKINGKSIQVLTQDGFELAFRPSELVVINSKSTEALQYTKGISQAIKDKEFSQTKKPKVVKIDKTKIPVYEVDLHIEKLVPSTRGMDNFDMLNLQLDTAKRQLEYAIGKKWQRVVFIHGVGEGVLRNELHHLLKRYDNLNITEADYQKYGRGATEVYIPQRLV